MWWRSKAAWGVAAAELFPFQLPNVKHNNQFRISGRKMCGLNTTLVGVAAGGKAHAIVSKGFWVR